MCRLAYIPGKAKISKTQFCELLVNLELDCGGDGNGFVAVSPEKDQEVHQKAVKLPNEIIVDTVYPLIRKGWSCYYHTRKISVGWKDDNQCHPFRISGKKWQGYLAHNGTWSAAAVLAKYLGVGSDTAAIATIIGKYGIDHAIKNGMFPEHGVFLLYGSPNKKTPATHNVLKMSGELMFCKKTKVWASSFEASWPWYNDIYDVANGNHDLEKDPPELRYKVKNTWEKTTCSIWKDTPGYDYRYGTYEIDFDAIDARIDSTYVDRNLLS